MYHVDIENNERLCEYSAILIDKTHNCPKCLKEKHFQNLMHMSETQYG
jgi:hypothetical protein